MASRNGPSQQPSFFEEINKRGRAQEAAKLEAQQGEVEPPVDTLVEDVIGLSARVYARQARLYGMPETQIDDPLVVHIAQGAAKLIGQDGDFAQIREGLTSALGDEGTRQQVFDEADLYFSQTQRELNYDQA